MSTSSTSGNGNGYISRGNFVATMAAATVIIGIIGTFASFVISSLSSQIEAVKKEQRNYLTVAVHDEFAGGLKGRMERDEAELALVRQNRLMTSAAVAESKRIDDRFVEFNQRIYADLGKVERKIIDDAKLVVPRDELIGRLTTMENNWALLSARINELRSTITAPYPVREQIDRLNSEISELRRQLIDRPK